MERRQMVTIQLTKTNSITGLERDKVEERLLLGW